MPERFEKHLAEIHAQQTISAALLNDILHAVSPSLWVMRWYDTHGYAEGVADARAKFVHDLATLEW